MGLPQEEQLDMMGPIASCGVSIQHFLKENNFLGGWGGLDPLSPLWILPASLVVLKKSLIFTQTCLYEPWYTDVWYIIFSHFSS